MKEKYLLVTVYKFFKYAAGGSFYLFDNILQTYDRFLFVSVEYAEISTF